MGEVMGNIVSVHVVVMDVDTTVLTLGLEVKADIVPMSWPNFIVWVCSMSEILGERQRQASSFEESHLSFKVLVFACVVLKSKLSVYVKMVSITQIITYESVTIDNANP